MKPLDTVAVPRRGDTIVLSPPTAATERAPDKLSAELRAKPDAATSLLYAVDGSGRVFTLSGSGERADATPGADWLPLQVSASAQGGQVWLLAKARSPGTDRPAEGTDYAVLRRTADGWDVAHRTGPQACRPVIGGGDGGVWLFADGRLRFVGGETAPSVPDSLDIEPVEISQGADGTLWLAGGAKRYGGLEVRRLSDDGSDWFLLPPPAAAISLAGAPDGSAWSVSTKGEVWRLSRDGAGTFRECGLDADCRRCFYKPDRTFARGVSAGSDGNLWFLSGSADADGYAIERMTDLESRDSEIPAPAARAFSIAATTR